MLEVRPDQQKKIEVGDCGAPTKMASRGQRLCRCHSEIWYSGRPSARPRFSPPLPLTRDHMTSSQRHRVALVVLSTLCALAWSFSSVGAVTVMNELPLQGCANIIRQLEGDNILVTLNGSRSAFHAPPYEGADYDLLSSLYFQWTDIREVGRNGAACSASLDTVVFAQNLHLCSCSITPILEVHDGATKSGWNLTISGCPSPQRDLVATAQVTVTNATFVEEFNYTMPGSTADAFNYTNAYVHLRTAPFSSISPSPAVSFLRSSRHRSRVPSAPQC